MGSIYDLIYTSNGMLMIIPVNQAYPENMEFQVELMNKTMSEIRNHIEKRFEEE